MLLASLNVSTQGIVVANHFDSEGCNVKFAEAVFHKFIVKESCEEKLKCRINEVAAVEDAGWNLIAVLMEMCEYGKFHSELVSSSLPV